MKKLLVVIDYQNDFVNGTLGFDDAEKLEPAIYEAVQQTLAEGDYVLFTRDTHPEEYLETREGKHLPVPHCIAGTNGHALFGRLHSFEETPQPHTMLLDKFTFGSPDIGQRAIELCNGAPDIVEVCGVVTDICVISNTLALHAWLPQAQIRVLGSLCGSGNKEAAQKAIDLLGGMGIEVTQ